jgi:hypothetical protein
VFILSDDVHWHCRSEIKDREHIIADTSFLSAVSLRSRLKQQNHRYANK